MIYLNRTTGDYPRFDGDVAIDPEADWVEVVQTTKPNDTEFYCWIEDAPELVDGRYQQAWRKIKRPEQLFVDPFA